ncbi:MAG: LAGLIDADG family homing endonuclease [Candidatus Paceibacterota bacterium]
MPANRRYKVKIAWSPEFAYVIGIIATDGNLSPDKRHINITSKDEEIVQNVKAILNLKNKTGKKSRENSAEKKYYVLQFGDINFYEFLNSIGLYKAKSKTIKQLQIPKKYFIDFLRGCIDGDGNISISIHPESKKPQLRMRLYSASEDFIIWIKENIFQYFKISGGWIYCTENFKKSKMYILSYGKSDSIKILNLMYHSKVKYFLTRKKAIFDKLWASGEIG